MRLGAGHLGAPTVTIAEDSAPPRIRIGIGPLRVSLSLDEGVKLIKPLFGVIAELNLDCAVSVAAHFIDVIAEVRAGQTATTRKDSQ